MGLFEAILFDFDGVLADTEPLHCACWAEVLAPLGVPLTWEYYSANCIGIDDREMLRVMAQNANPPRDWRELFALYPAKKALFMDRSRKEPPFDRRLDAMLAELKQTYQLAVVSSSAHSEIEPLLEAGRLLTYFDTVVGGDDVTKHKPAPEPYLLAAKRLGVSRALVVEDSAAGAESGRAAGFEVLRVGRAAEMPALLERYLAGSTAL